MGKPAIEGGSKSLRANLDWGQETTNKVADPEKLRTTFNEASNFVAEIQ